MCDLLVVSMDSEVVPELCGGAEVACQADEGQEGQEQGGQGGDHLTLSLSSHSVQSATVHSQLPSCATLSLSLPLSPTSSPPGGPLPTAYLLLTVP